MAIASNTSAALSAVAAVDPIEALPGGVPGAAPGLARDAAGAADFAAHFNSLGGVAALRAPAPGTMGAAEPSKLERLSSYFQDRGARHSAAMARAVTTRDAAEMLRLTAQGMDMGVQSELMAKFIGKTVSAVDAITKLN
jgi:hypothetical protein